MDVPPHPRHGSRGVPGLCRIRHPRPEPARPGGNPLLIALLRVLPISYDALEFTANIGMFIPIGALVAVLSRHWWLAVVVGIALTCGIEFMQQLLPTRYPEVRDILSNTLGATIGASVVALVAWAKRSRPLSN